MQILEKPMVDRQRWQESLRRARKILAESPEVRARKREAADRTTAKAREMLARLEVRRMLERQRAMDAIDAKLDELEAVANWLLYGKSRGAR
jgi:hypothetical protein